MHRDPRFGVVRPLCLLALESRDKAITKPALEIWKAYATDARADGAIALRLGPDLPALSAAALRCFHLWDRAVAPLRVQLFTQLRDTQAFQQLLLSSPVLAELPAPQQRIALQALRTLTGNRLKMLLNDLAAIANGENTADCLAGFGTGTVDLT